MDFGHSWDSMKLLVLGLDDVQPKVFDCQKYQAGLDPGKFHIEVALVEQAAHEWGSLLTSLVKSILSLRGLLANERCHHRSREVPEDERCTLRWLRGPGRLPHSSQE